VCAYMLKALDVLVTAVAKDSYRFVSFTLAACQPQYYAYDGWDGLTDCKVWMGGGVVRWRGFFEVSTTCNF